MRCIILFTLILFLLGAVRVQATGGGAGATLIGFTGSLLDSSLGGCAPATALGRTDGSPPPISIQDP